MNQVLLSLSRCGPQNAKRLVWAGSGPSYDATRSLKSFHSAQFIRRLALSPWEVGDVTVLDSSPRKFGYGPPANQPQSICRGLNTAPIALKQPGPQQHLIEPTRGIETLEFGALEESKAHRA